MPPEKYTNISIKKTIAEELRRLCGELGLDLSDCVMFLIVHYYKTRSVQQLNKDKKSISEFHGLVLEAYKLAVKKLFGCEWDGKCVPVPISHVYEAGVEAGLIDMDMLEFANKCLLLETVGKFMLPRMYLKKNEKYPHVADVATICFED